MPTPKISNSPKRKLYKAVRKNDISEAKKLIEEGVDPTIASRKYGALLAHACKNKDVTIELIEMLITYGCDVNEVNGWKGSALIQALIAGRQDIAQLLIRHGAQVNAANRQGETALHVACRRKDIPSITFLLENKANVDAKSSDGLTPLLDFTYDRVHPCNAATCETCDEDIEILNLLLKAGADPNAVSNSRRNVIHYVTMKPNARMLVFFAKLGVNVNLRNVDDVTPLEECLSYYGSELEIFKTLIEHNADPNLCNKNGETLLMRALQINPVEKRYNLLRILEKAKHDISITDNSGKTLAEQLLPSIEPTNNVLLNRNRRKMTLFLHNLQHAQKYRDGFDEKAIQEKQNSLHTNPESIKLTDIVLGKGAFSIVNRGTFDSKPVAVKVIKPEFVAHPTMLSEIHIFSRIRYEQDKQTWGSQYVVSLLAFNKTPTSLQMVFELMPQSVFDWIHNGEPRPNFDDSRSIGLDVCEGLSFLHNTVHVVHGDIKSTNLLIDKSGRVRISDFNSALLLPVRPFGVRFGNGCTPNNAPPELLDKQPPRYLAPATDMWSLSTVLADTLLGSFSFFQFRLTDGDMANILRAYERGERHHLPKNCPPELKKVIEGCWQLNPMDRMTADEAIEVLRPKGVRPNI
jgi:ankyrin repeat protein